ncbi:MAG: hypothetical protein PGN37_05895, partial [Mycobacterium kyogaense]
MSSSDASTWASVIRSPCSAMGRSSIRRARGPLANRRATALCRAPIAPVRNKRNSLRRSRSVDQAPAGDSASTDLARPRRANSRATHPPREFPTRWAFSIPAESNSRHRASTMPSTI